MSVLKRGQLASLVFLRMLIGWQIFYAGLTKFYDPSWTSKGFLLNSFGPFEGLFVAMGEQSGLVSFLDFLNLYGQLAIGAGLILGALQRVASVAGIVMMAMYYLAAPPFSRWGYEGQDLVVNLSLLLVAGLYVCYKFPTSRSLGVDRLVFGKQA